MFACANFYDFVLFYASAAVLLAGGDPYSIDTLNQQVALMGIPERVGFIKLIYPPWAVVFFAPLTLVSPNHAALFWFLIQVCSALLVVRCVSSWFEKSKEALWGAGLGLIIFAPLLEVIRWGQVGLVTAAVVSLCLTQINRRRDALAGVIAVLLTVKLHLTFLIIASCAAFTMQRRRWGFVLSLAGSWLFATVIAEHLSPGIVGRWLTKAPETLVEAKTYFHPLFLDWFVALSGDDPMQLSDYALTLPPLLLLGAVLWHSYRDRERPWSISNNLMYLAVSALFAPYLWMHDMAVLLPLHCYVIAAFATAPASRRAQLGFAFQIATILPAVVMQIHGGYPQSSFVWIPLSTLGSFLLAVSSRSKAREHIVVPLETAS